MRRGTAPYGASWKTLLPLGALLLFGAQGCGGDETVKTKIEQVDRCKDVQCAADEYCNGATGECVKKEGGNLCADKQCAADEYCDGATGQCVKKGGGGGGECDPPCGDGQVCDAETLTCIDLVEDLCQDVDCPAGKVCDGATGQCVDKAVDLCAEVQCPRGQCDPGSGTCVNPRSCAAEGQCLEGYFCFVMGGQGDCVVDRCVGVACPRGGVCDRLTGSCVDASPCESDEQCVGPNVVCEDGLCLPNCTVRPFPCPEGTVCDSERGICWQDLGRACAADGDCIGDHVCVENVCAPSCQEVPCRGARCRADGHCTPLGEDEECNGGIECADGEICIDGACTGDDPRFDCGDDGCPPGQRCGVFGCENPLLCERDADCLQGFVCHPEQNVCVACIFDEQCPGRQSCYAGTCIDARRCEDDEDCVGARTCNLQTHRCQPGPCAADRFEPNDGMAGAPLAGEGLFRGLTLCPGDEDWFKVFVPM
ncbi:MAG: hypothetical protein FJ125_12770, partial [Deltaproteobacteria bacterium]|nr:hypothetical protein [Deltaproteobacteria bacterium]